MKYKSPQVLKFMSDNLLKSPITVHEFAIIRPISTKYQCPEMGFVFPTMLRKTSFGLLFLFVVLQYVQYTV